MYSTGPKVVSDAFDSAAREFSQLKALPKNRYNAAFVNDVQLLPCELYQRIPSFKAEEQSWSGGKTNVFLKQLVANIIPMKRCGDFTGPCTGKRGVRASERATPISSTSTHPHPSLTPSRAVTKHWGRASWVKAAGWWR
jgi:hypothetical protein